METMTATQMAKLYGLKSPQAFNKMLVKVGVLKDTTKGHVLADDLKGLGLVVAIDRHYFLPNGFKATKKQAAWTEKGQAYIHQRLGRLGIVPIGEQRDMFSMS